jgi:hypothetical protein
MDDARAVEAELAARSHAEAVVANDIGATVIGMTPDGLAKAMQLGNTSWNYVGYELRSRGPDGQDFLFDIDFKTAEGAFILRYRFSHIDDVWKVVDIERVS